MERLLILPSRQGFDDIARGLRSGICAQSEGRDREGQDNAHSPSAPEPQTGTWGPGRTRTQTRPLRTGSFVMSGPTLGVTDYQSFDLCCT